MTAAPVLRGRAPKAITSGSGTAGRTGAITAGVPRTNRKQPPRAAAAGSMPEG